MLVFAWLACRPDAPEPRPRPYDYFRPVAWNREQGNLPPLATLFAARVPAALFGILGALCLYSVLRSLLPPGWAFAGSLLFWLNPLIDWFSRLATTDVIANSFSIGAILFGIRACQRPDRWAPVLLAGVLACAAVSSKLNAGILAPVLGAAFLIEVWLRRAPGLLLRAAASAALAALLFVVLNPTLYPDPLGGVLSLLRVGSEFGELKVMASIGQLDSVSSRVQAACEMLLGGAGMLASRLHAPLDHLLLPIGLALLAWRARTLAAARVILLWLLAALAAVSLWPPMRFERYYIPAIAPIAVAECLALALLLGLAVRGGSRAWRALGARGSA
jgi:4-amino-4-deoxy-L-arabinose transferase-like glycosyltransferase